MSNKSSHFISRRHLLGALAILCFGTGVVLLLWPDPQASTAFLGGSLFKSGIVLAAAWLAFPQLDQVPGWLFLTLVTLLVLVAVRPQIIYGLARYALLLLPIFVAIWLLRPKRRRA